MWTSASGPWSFPAAPGRSVLELTVPLGLQTSIEYAYLLGDFGVRVAGVEKTIIPPVRELAFGDWVPQGLPFYGGNVTYHIFVETRAAFCCAFPTTGGLSCACWPTGGRGRNRVLALRPFACGPCARKA
jgi:hypothetical protein